MKKINPIAFYHETNEWALKKEKFITIGITDFAQTVFGEIVFVELPEVGTVFKQGESFAITESNKASNEVFMPLSGKIIAINPLVLNQPNLLNTHPYSEGWMIQIETIDTNEWKNLRNAENYSRYIGVFFNKTI